MIKIQEHLNRLDSDSYLDILANELWEYLNPKLKNGKGYFKNSLIEKCKKFKNESSKKSYLIEYANNDVPTAKRQKAFFDYLLKSNAVKLKDLIISRPNQFSAVKLEIFNILQVNDLFVGTPGNYSQTKFGSLISDTIFNYKTFRGSSFCVEQFVKIGLDSVTCPYCNEKRINIIKLRSNSSKAVKLKAYLDLDHFYPKVQHPFFALSFFNLIPTCHDCNSRDKGDKLFTIETHVHPYNESFDDLYKFRVSLVALLGDSVNEIFIDKLPHKPLDITLNDLKLVDRYQPYLEQVENLVKYYLNYNFYLGSTTENVFIDAIFNINGGMPKERKDILKFERGKMKRDILKQIDINNKLNIL